MITATKVNRLHMDITGNCNLSCTYCFIPQRVELQRELTTAEFISIIDMAKDYGISRFSISGGEPLHNPDFFKILDRCKEPDSEIALFTNLHTATIQDLREITKGDNVKEIITSLDGFKGHDIARPPSKSDDVVEELKLVRELAPHCKLTVNTVIHKFNLDEMVALFRFLNSLGVNLWRLDFPLRPSKKDIFCSFEEAVMKMAEIIQLRYGEKRLQRMEIAVLRVYKSQLENVKFSEVEHLIDPKAHPCEYFAGTISIKQDGSISLCPPLDLIMGRVNLNEGFAEVVDRFSKHQFSSMNLNSIKQCSGCKYLQLCGTGCRADALNWTSDYKNADPISCSIMPLVEKHILVILSENLRPIYERMIDSEGKNPKYSFRSQYEMCS